MNGTPVIAFDDVAVGYGSDPVLTGLSFALNTGEAICFLGSNGSGKSTILRAAAKMCRVTAGSIRYLGEDLARLPLHDLAPHGLAYVTQTRGLFADLTVEENVRVACLGARGDGVESVAVIERFKLTPRFMKRMAGRLSGGERTIAALARALTARSRLRLLLLDEVSAGLSAANESILRTILLELLGNGVSLLMSEQNVSFAKALGIPLRQITRTLTRVNSRGTQ